MTRRKGFHRRTSRIPRKEMTQPHKIGQGRRRTDHTNQDRNHRIRQFSAQTTDPRMESAACSFGHPIQTAKHFIIIFCRLNSIQKQLPNVRVAKDYCKLIDDPKTLKTITTLLMKRIFVGSTATTRAMRFPQADHRTDPRGVSAAASPQPTKGKVFSLSKVSPCRSPHRLSAWAIVKSMAYRRMNTPSSMMPKSI